MNFLLLVIKSHGEKDTVLARCGEKSKFMVASNKVSGRKCQLGHWVAYFGKMDLGLIWAMFIRLT